MRFWILTKQETKALAVLALLAVAGALSWMFLPSAPRPEPRRLDPLPPPPKKAPARPVPPSK